MRALIALGSVGTAALEASIFADTVSCIGTGLGVHPVEVVGLVTAIERDASMLYEVKCLTDAPDV